MFWKCIFTYETIFRNVSKIRIETFYLHNSEKSSNFVGDFDKATFI